MSAATWVRGWRTSEFWVTLGHALLALIVAADGAGIVPAKLRPYVLIALAVSGAGYSLSRGSAKQQALAQAIADTSHDARQVIAGVRDVAKPTMTALTFPLVKPTLTISGGSTVAPVDPVDIPPPPVDPPADDPSPIPPPPE